ncbi:hypothetical protein, partial [Mobiluncus mulieris]|uniref:hypothetical protein n=1 Tax=Mobiluncus mulieris TaxID=2052 RepID=UPI001BA8838A
MKYFEYQILDSEDVTNETKLIQDFLDKHPLGNQDSLQKSTSISALDNFNGSSHLRVFWGVGVVVVGVGCRSLCDDWFVNIEKSRRKAPAMF